MRRSDLRHPTVRLVTAALLALMLVLAGCGRSNQRGTTMGAGAANDVLFRAIALVDTPYRYGGNTPEGGFDCSGLVGYVFREAAGLALPRTTRDLADLPVPRVNREKLRPGDLVFFGRKRPDHVGIYVGEGRFVHAPSSGGTVRLDQLQGHYWRDRYLGARRVLR